MQDLGWQYLVILFYHLFYSCIIILNTNQANIDTIGEKADKVIFFAGRGGDCGGAVV